MAAAESDDLIPANPVRKTRFPRRGLARYRAEIAPEKIRELLAALPEPSASLAHLLVFTGLRLCLSPEWRAGTRAATGSTVAVLAILGLAGSAAPGTAGAIGRWLGPGIARSNQDNDSGGNCNARLTMTFPQSGDYQVVVNTDGKYATGAFTLSVTNGAKPKSLARCRRDQ